MEHAMNKLSEMKLNEASHKKLLTLLTDSKKTGKVSSKLLIETLDAIAATDERVLTEHFGKTGLMLYRDAWGLDRSPVLCTGEAPPVKSVGNSTTPPHDIRSAEDARCIYYLLAESVAARLRQEGFRARCVTISARTTELVTRSHQRVLKKPTNLSGEIAAMAVQLFRERFGDGFPYRSVGVSCSHLTLDDAPIQLDCLGDEDRRIAVENMERSIDDLRRRFGHQVVQRGVVLTDRGFADINPVDDHTIHPVPFFSG